MELSKKLRNIRREKGMTLQELAQKSGVGTATISRLENRVQTGTLKTYLKICEALGIKLLDLYKGVESKDEEAVEITPEFEEIETFIYDDKASSVILTPNALSKRMLPVLIMLEPEDKTHQEQSPEGTEKFLFCLEGKIEITVGEKIFHLRPNGVLYFRSSLPHQLKNTGKIKARCLCVSSPAVL